MLIVARYMSYAESSAFIVMQSDSTDEESELYLSESVDTFRVAVSQTHGFIGKARRRRIDRRRASGSKRREEDGPTTWRDIADAALCKTGERTDTRAAGAVAMAAQP